MDTDESAKKKILIGTRRAKSSDEKLKKKILVGPERWAAGWEPDKKGVRSPAC